MQTTNAIRLSLPFVFPSAPSRNGGQFYTRRLLPSTLRDNHGGGMMLGAKHRRVSAFIPRAAVAGSVKLKAVVTLKPTSSGLFTNPSAMVQAPADVAAELLGRSLMLELVSGELDNNGKEKPTIKSYARHVPNTLTFEASFDVPGDFGPVGAVYVENEFSLEIWLKGVVISGSSGGAVNVDCSSWVQPKAKRVFFTTKLYLPSNTPTGLRRLRQDELSALRGDGKGMRKKGDRVYDYDVYNDLGDPDNKPETKRPVLGGSVSPYPRRCRTGRPMTKTDPSSETRNSYVYVPRDEEFSEVKTANNNVKLFEDALHAAIPMMNGLLTNSESGFTDFNDIDDLYREDHTSQIKTQGNTMTNAFPNLMNKIISTNVLRFDPPPPLQNDKFFWLRDDEFGRETLAGLNPCVIKLVQSWPLSSSLDAATYGPPESAITTELVERQLGGMTVAEAIQQKKLFIIDYHDILLPLVPLIRQQKGTTLYGSRALFCLTSEGMLRPLAIELVRPPMDGKPQWKQAFTPGTKSTDVMLWRLAKVHFLAHDGGYHELISHWLRTHAVTEPYIISMNRHLSTMHPIYQLLNPHFRYTMEINARARSGLINAGGIIESSFSPLNHSIKLSSIIYDKVWRFDHESLPNDLISRGMAVSDASSPHGLKLTIEDYPYANDGLLIWDAIKQWVTQYVTRYYPDQALILADTELQTWWNEVRNVGHADKKDQPWWPKLETCDDLVGILTTIIWVASGHHAAVNFGQYMYAGYFPNRPTIARINMPAEYAKDSPEYNDFLKKPETWLLKTLPSRIQATSVIVVLDSLSVHASDEEYLGTDMEPAWADDGVIKTAFQQFGARMKEIESLINARNNTSALGNRNGAGVVPYELLLPFSTAGVTNRGVPNSISI